MWLAAGGLVGEEKGLLLAAFGEGGDKRRDGLLLQGVVEVARGR